MVAAKTEALEAALRYVAEKRWAVDTRAGVIIGTRYHRVIGSRLSNGYLAVTVRLSDGREASVLAHRVIWAVAHQTSDFGMLNHRNGTKTDNRLANLELATASENIRHAVRTGLWLGRMGEQHHHARFTADDVRQMRVLRQQGLTLRAIGEQFGAAETVVSRIVRRQAWAHIP